MSAARHTPGPWEASSEWNPHSLQIPVTDADGGPIANVWGGNDEALGNARLIAAAPVAYQSGWADGYAEGYGCKLADATEAFNPVSLAIPHAVEAVADMLLTKYAATFADRPSAIGCARAMLKIASQQVQP